MYMYVYAVAASFYKLVQESAISGLRWQHRWQKEVLTGGGANINDCARSAHENFRDTPLSSKVTCVNQWCFYFQKQRNGGKCAL